jgi:hypothetical protein
MRDESAEAPSEGGWLVLVYRVPGEPTRLRSTVWRRLRSMGAVYLQNSVAAMPAGRASEHALRKLRREILDMEGTAWLLSADALSGDTEIRGLFEQARDAEYEEILDKCADFHAGLEKEYAASHFTYGELEENEVELVKLRSWMEKVRARDSFGAPLREKTEAALSACAEALEAYAARVFEEDGEGA